MSNDPLIDAMVNGIDLSVLKLTDDDVIDLKKEMIEYLLKEVPDIWCWYDDYSIQYEVKNIDGDLVIGFDKDGIEFRKRHESIVDQKRTGLVVLKACLFIANKIKGGTQYHNDSIYN